MQKRKVLLVDDVQLFLEQEKTFFNREIFDLLVARSGIEALKIVKEEKPELVFMDLYMPDMDGDRCCHMIKSDRELRGIPVIMVTTGVDEDDFERCWQAGCDDIITKPIHRHYFLAIIRKYIPLPERKAPPRPLRPDPPAASYRLFRECEYRGDLHRNAQFAAARD